MTVTENTSEALSARQRLRVIDVAVAFDAATIMDIAHPSPDPNNPTEIGPENIYIMTAGKRVAGNPGQELSLDAKVGDVVKFRETTLSSNFDYSVLLYRFTVGEIISNPVLLLDETVVPYASDSSQGSDQQTVMAHSWAAFVTSMGWDSCRFAFQIISRGRPMGYFCWDLFVTTGR